jgi:hypothetical protein
MLRANYFITPIALFLLTTSSLFAGGRTSRDLIFEEDEPLAVEKSAEASGIDDPTVLSIRTTIELTRDKETSTVLPTHTFKSGDSVRFVYTTNTEGYIYWLTEGSTGKVSLIFPNNKTGLDNTIVKNKEYNIPVKGRWKFDSNSGTEKILAILSPTRIAELDKEVGIDSAVNDVKQKNKSKMQSRDLVFEEDEDEETGVSTKSQASNGSDVFVTYYELVHK